MLSTALQLSFMKPICRRRDGNSVRCGAMADGVKALSDRGTEPPPEYLLEEAARPIPGDTCSRLQADIPVVDVMRLSQSKDEIAKLHFAVSTWGMFQATGHGISSSLLDELRSVGRRFFQLLPEEKQRISYRIGGFGEGYGRDPVTAKTQDWTDRLLLKVQPMEERDLQLWPQQPSSFRQTLEEYTEKVNSVASHVIQALARAIDLDDDHFTSQLGEEREIFCRLSYYPPCLRPDRVFGLRPHTDNSAITVILQDGNVNGLELLTDEGSWVRAPNNPDLLLVQVGDLMEIMSNGLFKSRMHRVVTNSHKDRLSVSMFFAMNPKRIIGPAEDLLKDKMQRVYRNLNVKEYLEVHLKAFAEGKKATDWARV